jgi:peptidyl-prolyl cis-trans isomerase B (cyclophilin B)
MATPESTPPSQASSRRPALIFVGALAAIAIVVVVVILITGGSDDGSSDASVADINTCQKVDAPPPKDVQLPAPTATSPTATGATFNTSCGSFTIEFDPNSPKTAASMEYLVDKGFYDGLAFHRVVPGFVVQGGDPAGDGSGGPGYSVTEAPPKDTKYTKGVVAMAKTGTEAPGTSGSQFFVVSGADAGLPPDYAVAGKVTEGMDTIDRIDALGQGDGPPSMPVVIDSATLVQ